MEGFFGIQEAMASGDIMFVIVPLFILLIFIIVIGVIVTRLIRAMNNWNKNNQQPRITSPAKVVTKRTDIRGGGETRAYNDYYVTFELSSGERKEFEVKGEEFGQLVEGDVGEVEFQGTRYVGFSRHYSEHQQ